MYDNFWTPIKDADLIAVKYSNTATQVRSGDWICSHCNNLNFSFRKKCNRCKTQTKKHNNNETTSVYSHYYYKPEAKPLDSFEQNFPTTDFLNTANNQTVCFSNSSKKMKTPEKKQKHPQQYQSKQQNILKNSHHKQENLPSVSPLVKKYRQKQHHTTLQKMNKLNLFDDNDKYMDSIEVRDFNDILMQDEKDTKYNEFGTGMKFKLPISENSIKNTDKWNKQNQDSFPQQDDEMDNYMKQMEQIIGRIII